MGTCSYCSTMWALGVLSLLASAQAAPQFELDNQIQRSKPQTLGASTPSNDGFEWHFNQMGVLLDLALKDQLAGGQAHVELPISAVWGLLEGENPMMKTMVTALGTLYDVQTVKADISYNAEKLLEGIYDMSVDYTLVHKDGTEENATLSF